MSTTKQPDFADLNALAIEACDMWQDHLSTFANDPAARAELTRFLEPQRRLFADWTALIQKGVQPVHPDPSKGGEHDGSPRTPPSDNAAPGHDRPGSSDGEPGLPPTCGDDDDGDTLRVAQLAYRVAELEKRLAEMESRLAGAPRRNQRATP